MRGGEGGVCGEGEGGVVKVRGGVDRMKVRVKVRG